jgi:uncharacterized membrane protein YczE
MNILRILWYILIGHFFDRETLDQKMKEYKKDKYEVDVNTIIVGVILLISIAYFIYRAF